MSTRVSTTSSLAFILTFTLMVGAAIAIFFLYFRNLDESGIRLNHDVKVSAVLLDAKTNLIKGRDLTQTMKKLKAIQAEKSSFDKEKLKKIYELFQGYGERKKQGKVRLTHKELEDKKVNLLSDAFSLYRSQVKLRNFEVAAIAAAVYQDVERLDVDADADLKRFNSLSLSARQRLSSIYGIADRYSNPGLIRKLSSDLRIKLTRMTSQYEAYRNFKGANGGSDGEIFAAIESAINDMRKKSDDFISSSRSEFIYAILLFAICLGLGAMIMLVTAKRIQAKMDRLSVAFMKVLNKFAQPEEKDHVKNEINLLMRSGDWGRIYKVYSLVEEKFLKRNGSELAFARSINTPYFILNEDNRAIYWNSHAIKALSIGSIEEIGEQSPGHIFDADLLGKNEKQGKIVANELNDWISNKNEFVYQFFVRTDGKIIPYEMSMTTIKTGLLAGGKIVTLRNCVKESDIINKHVERGLAESRHLIEKLIDGDFKAEIDSAKYLALPPAAARQIDLIKELRVKIFEKEKLWKSETEALLDQNRREKEILEQLMQQLNEIRNSNAFFEDLSKVVTQVGQRIDTEWHSMEKHLNAWDKNWKRIQRDFDELVNVADRAQIYEDSVRKAIDGFRNWMEAFDVSVEGLERGKELVKVHALNLNFVDEKDIDELKQKARMMASSINTYYEAIVAMREEVNHLVERHPGSSEYKSLEDQQRVYALIQDMHKEFDDLSKTIRSWKGSNAKLIEIGKKATDVLKSIESKEESLVQLYDACRLINEKAQESLTRWG